MLWKQERVTHFSDRTCKRRRFLSLGLEGCVGVDGAEDMEEN